MKMLKRINKTVIIASALLLVMILGIGSLLLDPLPANAAEATAHKYTAVQDADISSSSSSAKDKVYGESSVVTSSTSSLRRAILQFNVDGIEEIDVISSVQLVLYVESMTSENFDDLSVRVEETDANGWSQSSVTWNNRKTQFGIDYSIDVDILSIVYDEDSKTLNISLDPSILSSDYVTNFKDPNADQQLITLGYAGTKMTVCSTEGAKDDPSKFAPYLLINNSFDVVGESNNSSYGTVSSSASSVVAGGSVTYTITPAAGYYVLEAFLNGEDVLNLLTENSNGSYTLNVTGIDRDTTLSVGFVSSSTVSYNISVGATENGSVTADSYKIAEGNSVKYTIIPDEHYAIGSVTVNGNDVTNLVKNGILELTPDCDQTISVSFIEAEIKYTLSVTATDGGTVYFGSDPGVLSVTKWSTEWSASSGNTVLNILPAAGYKIESIGVGNEYQAVNGYQLTIADADVSESREYKVVFAKDEPTADSTAFYPTGDTMIYSGSLEGKNTVNGDQTTASVKSSSSERIFLMTFDLGSITDFSSVKLNVYNNFSGSGWGSYQLKIYALTQVVDDATTTWNTLEMDGVIFKNDDGVRESSRGTLITTLESDSVSKKSWITVDVTQIVNAAKLGGMESITLMILNSDIGSTSSSPIPFETKESNLLVDGQFARPHLSVTKKADGDALLPILPEYKVTVTGVDGIKLNGEEKNSAAYSGYTPVTVDFSDIAQDMRIESVTVNGIERQLVENKLYLNGYIDDVTVDVNAVDLHRIDIECDEQIIASAECLMLTDTETETVVFKVQAGYRATVTVNGITYYYTDNTIVLEDITADTVVKIIAVAL